MGFYEHIDEFANQPVYEFTQAKGLESPGEKIPRLRVDWDSEDSVIDLLTTLLEDPEAERLTGLVIGAWAGEDLYDTNSGQVVEILVASADQLPSLRALFLGDILQEENEVSWIQQTDVSPLWAAFPKLEYLGIRGSDGLSLGSIQHDSLKSLVIECGGLPSSIVKQICQAKLPNLEHLELYLGTDNYGWDGDVETVRPLLEGGLFPKLSYLGLRNSEIADAIAVAAADAPVLKDIKVLDLSLGTLGDQGGEALLNSAGVKSLERLDLHYHFMSNDMVQKLNSLPISTNVTDRQQEDEYDGEIWRYISVSE